MSTEKNLYKQDANNTLSLFAKLDNLGERKVEDGFQYYKLDDPEKLLVWIVRNDFLLHGTTQRIRILKPRKANDTRRESGRKIAVYMTDDAVIAMFMALVGGTGISGHTSFSSSVKSSKVSSKITDYTLTVDNQDKIQNEGYVYIFLKNQIDSYVDGEYHAYKSQKPLVSLKIEKKDFHYPIQVMSQSKAEALTYKLESL